MQAVTIHQDTKYNAEMCVIGTYDNYGRVQEMFLAEIIGEEQMLSMRINRVYFGAGDTEITLTAAAAANLVAFYQERTGTAQPDNGAVARLIQENETLRAQLAQVTETRDALQLDRDKQVDALLENSTLRAQMAMMKEQELFEMALLRDVAEKARRINLQYNATAPTDEAHRELEHALDAHETWKADIDALKATADVAW